MQSSPSGSTPAGDADLILSDVSHRVNNAFAVIRALVGFGESATRDMGSFADTLRNQVEALAIAHKLSTEAARRYGRGADNVALRKVIESALASRMGIAADDQHAIRIACPQDIALAPADLSNLTMILYELAANAVKHGALRPSGGTVAVVVTRAADGIILHWTESGSAVVPPQKDAKAGTSFGQTILTLCASNLGATFSRKFDDRGMRYQLQFKPQM